MSPGPAPAATVAAVLDAAALAAPDPADARRRAERFCEAAAAAGTLPDLGLADAVHVLTLACQRAPYLATLLTRDPRRLARVAADPYLHREKPAAAIAAAVAREVDGATDAAALAAGLRRARATELIRLGVRELELGLDTEVGRELAHLADACFAAAIRFHDAALRARHGAPRYVDDHGVERDAGLVVIGMGKLGGEELNFSSDVDVIYVYSSDAGAAGALTLHEYFAKLATLITAALSEVTEDDLVFRVDLRLRPEGSRGAIANSLAQLERYYETFGRPWERQAWLKARACAGDAALGAAVIDTMRPFVHRRHTSPTIVDEVRELNRRIKAELVAPAQRRARATRGGDAAGAGPPTPFDVKNGEGGIREVEFFAQALQLIHSGRTPGLRVRGTLAALDALLFAGLVGDDEHLALFRAYRWLRHVEHLLQLESGRQTQTIPGDAAAVEVLARRLGYADAAAFTAALSDHTAAVARLFATLGEAAPGPPPAVEALLAGDLPAERERELLARLGFADPAGAAAELERARRRPESPLSPAATGVAARVGPALLDELARSADPDQALRHVVDLLARRGPAASVWRLVDDNRAFLRLVVSILGASEYLARTLVERPELLDLLVGVGESVGAVDDGDDVPARARAASARVARITAADPGDEELVWATLAETKNLGVLQVGLADFAGALDPLAVCAELTAIAEASLRVAYDHVAAAMVARHGTPRAPDGAPVTMAVLGLGKLGGRELGYAADLDVVFVYGADGESDGPRPLANVEYMTRLAQRLMTGLHARTPRGRLYEVDTRLRPSGSQGLLVSSLTGWRRYHEAEARLWERQALIKLRPVAGDLALGADVAAQAHRHVWGAAPGGADEVRAIAREVAAMRDRVETQLGARHDLKVGRGGIIDVEFAAQYVQLVWGHAHPALRTPSTAEALRAAAEAGVADVGALILLADGYRFLRLVEHRLRVVHDRPVHRLPDEPRELDKLARRTGFPSGEVLRRRVERWQHDIRAAYDAILRAGA